MRTTLNLDSDLIQSAKEEAARTGRTLTSVIEDALRQNLFRGSETTDVPTELMTSPGAPLPGVDLDDSADLLDLMETDVPS